MLTPVASVIPSTDLGSLGISEWSLNPGSWASRGHTMSTSPVTTAPSLRNLASYREKSRCNLDSDAY